MMKKTHINIGLACIIPFLSWHNLYVIPIAILGAIMPDFDIKLGLRHRGASHSLLVAFAIWFLTYLLFGSYADALLIGYISHLFADSFTVRGVPLLWPFSRKNYGIRIIHTDSGIERSINIIVILVIIWLLLTKLNIF